MTDRIVYFGSDFRSYSEASVGLLSHGLQYGVGCFEGIRAYWSDTLNDLLILDAADHFARLLKSARILALPIPYDVPALVSLAIELCKKNGFREDIYIRPLVYDARDDIGCGTKEALGELAMVACPFVGVGGPTYSAAISSWRRIAGSAAPVRAKTTGLYVNSTLARREARANGFDETILLNAAGFVAEGAVQNVFLIQGDTLVTPDPSQDILEGLTRRWAIEFARKTLHLTVIERSVDRSELYAAEEVFLAGTGSGIMGITTLDRRPIGNGRLGLITEAIAKAYALLAHGNAPVEGRNTRVYRGVLEGQRVAAP